MWYMGVVGFETDGQRICSNSMAPWTLSTSALSPPTVADPASLSKMIAPSPLKLDGQASNMLVTLGVLGFEGWYSWELALKWDPRTYSPPDMTAWCWLILPWLLCSAGGPVDRCESWGEGWEVCQGSVTGWGNCWEFFPSFSGNG